MKLAHIKKGKLQTFTDWCRYIHHSGEALVTLKEERTIFECCYTFTLNGEHYAFFITDNDHPLPASDRAINRKHKAILKECLEPATDLLPLYRLHL